MDFKLKHLRYFVAVAEEESVTRAAARLRVAQPSLSLRIRTLEDFVGFPLFIRSQGRVYLSDQGRALLPGARTLVAEAERLGRHIQSLRVGGYGSVRVAGSLFSLGRPERQLLIEGFLAKHPELEVVVQTGFHSPELLSKLEQGLADFVFVIDSPPKGGGFESLLLRDIPLEILLPAELPIAQKKSVALADLAGLRVAWYRREENQESFDEVRRVLGAAGATVVAPLDTWLDARVRHAISNRTATLVPAGAPFHAPDMALLPIEGAPLILHWSLVRAATTLSASAARFWEHALQVTEKLAAVPDAP